MAGGMDEVVGAVVGGLLGLGFGLLFGGVGVDAVLGPEDRRPGRREEGVG